MSTATASSIDKATWLDLYRRMLVIRKTELQLAKSHQRGLVHGACHTYVGQEAVAVGVLAHFGPRDMVFSTHRGHGHALAKGMPPEDLIAELYGRVTGCSRGRGGSMHLFAPEIGMMGTSGIVGPCILQAAGAGYTFKLKHDDAVAAAFFGDGAVNNGAFHEGLNLASIYKLPVLFVCENNQYATEVPFKYSAGNPQVASRGGAYGIPGVEVDGNDLPAVYAAAQSAVERARRGLGPTLIECRTYRTRPHAEGMTDFTYRSRDEVDQWKNRCPIARSREALIEAFGDEEDAEGAWLDEIEDDVTAEVEQAHSQAVEAAYPAAEDSATHVFAAPRGEAPSPPPRFAPDVREKTFVEATVEALRDAIERNSTAFVMGEGVGERGGNFKTTDGLYKLFGAARVCDTPISERGFVGLACGAAMSGSRPVVDFMFADFILDAAGEIINQIAKVQYMSNGRIAMPVVLRGCIGVGHSAATHHSGSYYSMYGHFPGLKVVVPSTPYDAKGLFAEALAGDDPVLFLEHRELLTVKGHVPEPGYRIPFGQATIVREGGSVTIVALAQMVHKSLAAAETLAAQGISVELIDPRTVAPLDVDAILKSVAKTGRLLIVDETFGPFGLGAEIAASVADRGFDDLDAPVKRLNGKHAPTPYSPALENNNVPHTDDIVGAVQDLMAE
ncbi:MAG: dehydrogenase E1 component subunit alpha/beta [Pirellulales bacterium]|nr:dehydrogenase E1 component subunit alpha/beta [Pirellulales bacterium]